MTKGIVKPITYEYQLYNVLKGTAQSDPSSAVRKQNIYQYNKILTKSKREEKYIIVTESLKKMNTIFKNVENYSQHYPNI